MSQPPDALDAPPAALPPEPPTRIWPSLVVAFLGIPAAAILTLCYLRPLSTIHPLPVDPLDDLDTMAFAVFVFDLILLGLVYFAAERSPVPVPERLAYRPVSFRWWEWVAIVFATEGISLLTVLGVARILDEPPEDAQLLLTWLDHAGGMAKVGLAFGVAVMAPIVEETLFRGYVLGGLLRRWTPFWAILVSSYAFALAHGSVGYQLLILPFGLYLGILTYRTRSIFPAMARHAYGNGLATVGFFMTEVQRLWLFRPPGEPSAFEIAGLVALPVAIWVLVKGAASPNHVLTVPNPGEYTVDGPPLGH